MRYAIALTLLLAGCAAPLSPAGKATAETVERMAGEYPCGTLQAIVDKPDVNVEIDGLPDAEAIRVMKRAMKAARKEMRKRC